MALKDEVERWQNQKKWVFDWAIMNLIASQTCVLLTTCSCAVLHWCRSKMMCDYKQSTQSVGLKIHPDYRKF